MERIKLKFDEKNQPVDYQSFGKFGLPIRRERDSFALNFVMVVFGASMFLLSLFLWSFL